MKEVVTVRQTAQKLSCTLKYIYDLLYAGKLDGARKQGKRWEIPASSLDAWKRQRVRSL
jgi:excisionase family DNA binding protein